MRLRRAGTAQLADAFTPTVSALIDNDGQQTTIEGAAMMWENGPETIDAIPAR